ncbi:MAG TPA: cysteine desulfurase [Gemmatimonadales bacterium]|nr:cysteine desulfurase [Gemmatimonadales bacterium]
MAGADPFDAERARKDFPGLAARIRGYPLIYLDNAATSQRPRQVIEAISSFELTHAANVHRGVHTLSQRATAAYDEAREKVRGFINAGHASEIIFTSGTTASLNLVAGSYGRRFLKSGDEILITEMEHHSNLVPWQLIAEQTGALVRALPVNDRGELERAAFGRLIGPRTRIVALAHVSNVLGTVNPVREMADLAHTHGAVVVVDGAQAVPHLPVDVQQLGCDFYAASAHKMYGPTGVGFLYGRLELLEKMPPWQGGGGMIERVAFEGTTFAPPPARFEAGTPPIAQAVGLGVAIDYLKAISGESLARHEQELLSYATARVGEVPGIRLIGTAKDRVSVLSFSVEGVHPHDVGTVLDARGVAVRAGHHCAQPLMRRFGVQGTVRASFGLYNRREEVDALVAALGEVRKVFG